MFVEDAFEDGDIVNINTVPGEKYATRTRSAFDTNLMNKIPAASIWTQLSRGTNHIRVAIVGDPVPFTLAYRPAYGGL